MKAKINSEDKLIVQDQRLFTGCYRIPKGEAFDPYSINVAHVLKMVVLDQCAILKLRKKMENGLLCQTFLRLI